MDEEYGTLTPEEEAQTVLWGLRSKLVVSGV
jgi:hypothetical protein